MTVWFVYLVPSAWAQQQQDFSLPGNQETGQHLNLSYLWWGDWQLNQRCVLNTLLQSGKYSLAHRVEARVNISPILDPSQNPNVKELISYLIVQMLQFKTGPFYSIFLKPLFIIKIINNITCSLSHEEKPMAVSYSSSANRQTISSLLSEKSGFRSSLI